MQSESSNKDVLSTMATLLEDMTVDETSTGGSTGTMGTYIPSSSSVDFEDDNAGRMIVRLLARMEQNQKKQNRFNAEIIKKLKSLDGVNGKAGKLPIDNESDGWTVGDGDGDDENADDEETERC